MTEQPPSPPVQDSDYDGAWKEGLRMYLRQVIERYFPAVAAVIAWEHPPVWSDKELSQILGQTGRRNRTVDLLVKLRLRDGGEQWILLHLEIQTSYEPDFAERLALYNSGLFWSGSSRNASSPWPCWPTCARAGYRTKIGSSWPILRPARDSSCAS